MEPIKKQVFLDGICDIYRIGSSGQPEMIFAGIPLDKRTVGSRRSFDAMQAGHIIARVIRVPRVPQDLNDCYVMMGTEQFQILQAQEIFDTCPKCLQLTLEHPNIRWADEQEEV